MKGTHDEKALNVILMLEDFVRDFREQIRYYIAPELSERADFCSVLSDVLRLYCSISILLIFGKNTTEILDWIKDNDMPYANDINPQFIENMMIGYPDYIETLRLIMLDMYNGGKQRGLSSQEVLRNMDYVINKTVNDVAAQTSLLN